MKSMAWREQARCKGIDPEVFYPVSDEESDEAKSICAECPVRLPCLEFALAARERDGFGVEQPKKNAAASFVSAARLRNKTA